MFDFVGSSLPGESAANTQVTATLAGWVVELGRLGPADDAELVDRIRALEELKAAASAAQAQAAVALEISQRAAQAVAGVPAARRGAGVAAQVGLARRESPNRGARHLGMAKILVAEMPRTLAALAAGRISEWRAMLLVRETGCLPREHRESLDRELAGDRLAELEMWGDRRLVAEAQRTAYRLDPQAALARVRRAENDRRVSCRPAPETMAYLTALLPVAQAAACYAALHRTAETALTAGDPRSRGQVMADAMVEQITGQSTASDTPVEIQLVITDSALFANAPTAGDGDHAPPDPAEPDPADEPGELLGYGPVPAGWSRELIGGLSANVRTTIRRIRTDPTSGNLIAMESRARIFPPGLRQMLVTRDRTCRTPWCDAPIRHADHALPHGQGGATSVDNGQGLCQACNHAKQAPGWAARPWSGPDRAHAIHVTTPTGHTHCSTAPAMPGARQPTPAERRLKRLFSTAA